jgi:DNA helicase-2/ATP-dependent DNA helicase PcrA
MKITEQQDLILSHEGCAVVIASPGSGKTFVLSKKIKQNLKILKAHEGVIAISYTNKASDELRNRSLSEGENPMSSFFGTIDKFYISEIIVPFGKHIWGIPENEIEIKKIDSLPNDEKSLFDWFSRDASLEAIQYDQIDVFKEYFKKGLVFIEAIGVMANYVYTNSCACRKYIKARYRYLYIDEYQDSGLFQHELFIKIMNLGVVSVAVGDLNQSIYAFSGKDSRYLDELTRNDKFKYFVLDKNHRCHSSIINYSNYLLNNKTELLRSETSTVYFKRIAGTEFSVSAWIDRNVPKILKAFNVDRHNQIAILTRGNRTADLINRYLKTKHKLFISNDLDNNLNVWSGIFSNLLSYQMDPKRRFVEVVEEFILFDRLNRSKKNDLNALKNRLGGDAVYDYVDKGEMCEIFKRIAKIISPNSENNESVILLDKVLQNRQEFESYRPADDHELNIMTLHKSKGLEYEVVIHLDLHEWVLPSKRPGVNNDFNNPVYGDYIQDINLHYVGITRARKACFLISSTNRTNSNNTVRVGRDSEFLWINQIEKLRNIISDGRN